jgi:hypothetical protein
MEITYENQAFIVTALEAHIKSLREECAELGEGIVTDVIESRIAAIAPVLDALNSGDYFLELQEA